MIAVGNKYKKKKNSVLLARNVNTNQNIYYVDDEEFPLQKIKGSPLKLINTEELLKCFKKYGLKKDEISKLINFYTKEPEQLSLELGDDFKLRMCFKKLEDMMLTALKNIYIDPSADLEVYHDPELLLGIAMIGPSHSGKTYAATSILLRWPKIKVYVFTQNPSDPSITRLKERGKYTIMVDLKKINKPLKLSDVSPGSILLMDDIFEMRRGEDANGHDLRKNLINLINQTLSRGRHHRKTKNSRGTSVIICAHMFKNAHDSRVLWNEVNALYVYPSSSHWQILDFLVKKIGLHKTNVEEILNFSKGARSLCFKIGKKPMNCVWKNGIYLL